MTTPPNQFKPHKIYLGIITLLSLALVFCFGYYMVIAAPAVDTVKREFGSQRMAPTAGGQKLSCRVILIDKDTNRIVSHTRFIFAVDNKCPEYPVQFQMSKQEYIKQISENDTWGIFDESYLTPEMRPVYKFSQE